VRAFISIQAIAFFDLSLSLCVCASDLKKDSSCEANCLLQGRDLARQVLAFSDQTFESLSIALREAPALGGRIKVVKGEIPNFSRLNLPVSSELVKLPKLLERVTREVVLYLRPHSIPSKKGSIEALRSLKKLKLGKEQGEEVIYSTAIHPRIYFEAVHAEEVSPRQEARNSRILQVAALFPPSHQLSSNKVS
jgi:hypothetical protein